MVRSSALKIILLLFLVSLLVMIRAYEQVLFYDPFRNYFKTEFSQLEYPSYDWLPLFLNLIYRYFLNGLISIAIIFVIFKDVSMVKFSTLLLFIFLIILLLLMFLILNYFDENSKMTLFYIRRFLIQPIFLLLFVPAFYYQKVTVKK